jgi:hypothetical protein
MPDLPAGMNQVALGQATKGWHNVRVEVRDHRVRVTADKARSVAFDVQTIRDHLGDRGLGLDARGLLGVWVRNSRGNFRNGAVTVLAPAAPAR